MLWTSVGADDLPVMRFGQSDLESLLVRGWHLGFLVSCSVVLLGGDVLQVLPEAGAVAGLKQHRVDRKFVGIPRNVRSRVVLILGVVLEHFEGAAAAGVVVRALLFDAPGLLVKGQRMLWPFAWLRWSRVRCLTIPLVRHAPRRLVAAMIIVIHGFIVPFAFPFV